MPHFQEGLKLNQWIRTKCKKNLVGPIFLLLEKKNLGIFFPMPSLQELLFSIRSKLYVLYCILSGRTPQV